MSVMPVMAPVQVATVFVVCVIVRVVKFVPDGELYCSIGNQTNSTPMLFNSARVMSTPVPG